MVGKAASEETARVAERAQRDAEEAAQKLGAELEARGKELAELRVRGVPDRAAVIEEWKASPEFEVFISDFVAPYWIKGYYSGVEYLRELRVTIPLEECNLTVYYEHHPIGYGNEDLSHLFNSESMLEQGAEEAPQDEALVQDAPRDVRSELPRQ